MIGFLGCGRRRKNTDGEKTENEYAHFKLLRVESREKRVAPPSRRLSGRRLAVTLEGEAPFDKLRLS